VRFVDSSFWVALVSRRDSHHAEAAALWSQGQGVLLTSNHVLGETWTFLRRRAGHQPAVTFLQQTRASRGVTVQFVGEDTEADAWRWLRRHDEREYSFVDATSFALMRRLRLSEALAFDGDFAAAGFVELRPEA
jgi:predicted nucleic acid-binding protein